MSDIPVDLNLDIYRGAGFRKRLRLVDGAGASHDVSNWTAEAQIRRDPQHTEAHSLTVSKPAAEEGLIELSLTGAGTATLPAGHHSWDLLVKVPGHQPKVPVAGVARIRAEVTR